MKVVYFSDIVNEVPYISDNHYSRQNIEIFKKYVKDNDAFYYGEQSHEFDVEEAKFYAYKAEKSMLILDII
jgi:hypothetical protein